MMKRREFIAGLAGAAAWPVAARTQQPSRMPRIGVLMALAEDDPNGKAYLSAFMRGFAEAGWVDGHTVRIDVRWTAASVDQARMLAKELVDLKPDVILSQGTPVTAALQHETRTIPIVFAAVSDPIGEGFIASLARPGGNMTGFANNEVGMVGKWLELLIEIAPSVNRAAVIFNPDTSPGGGSFYMHLYEAAARLLKVAPIIAPVHSDTEFEAVISSLGRERGGGLVVPPDTFTNSHRELIISLAARNNVPAVYALPVFATDGGLLSYGANIADVFRRSAAYVDRIVRGAKPADLPVQLPTEFVMILNAKTAKALGLTVPQSILLRADEVIE
jgi:putative tryptophan/tyrosine transport system substrate-binding protein